MRFLPAAVLVLAALAACDPETSSYAAERFQGGCRDPLPTGGAPGAACAEAADCAGFCCTCAAGLDSPYGGQLCLNGACADVDEACATIEREKPQLCVAALVFEQAPEGTCPATLKEGVAVGDVCIGADECASTCCACASDATRGYAAAQCAEDACAATTDACAAALATDPALCP
jgi:hypothetical protein